MSYAQPQHRFDAEAYLAWEATQNERHEFVRGEVFAMAGGTQNHNAVSGNAYMALRLHLRGTPCKVFFADLRVQVEAVDAYFYPDVVVHCPAGVLPDGHSSAVNDPILIIEVLSDSTSAWDRGGKFAAYRELASLKEYVLIDPNAQTVEVYRRNVANRFELYAWDRKGVEPGLCEFSSVGLSWPLDAVFEGVDPTQPTPSDAEVQRVSPTS